MVKGIILMIFCTLFFNACNEDTSPVYYQYGGVCITRINEGDKILFYYGNTADGDAVEPHIVGTLQGFDAGVGGYLVFHDGDRVQLIRDYGELETVGNDQRLYLTESLGNPRAKMFRDSIAGNFGRIAYLSHSLELERATNRENRSKVIIKY